MTIFVVVMLVAVVTLFAVVLPALNRMQTKREEDTARKARAELAKDWNYSTDPMCSSWTLKPPPGRNPGSPPMLDLAQRTAAVEALGW